MAALADLGIRLPLAFDAETSTIVDAFGAEIATIDVNRERHDDQVEAIGRTLVAALDAREDGACRVCGCTDDRACVTDAGPCHWVEPALCSACADKPEAL